MHAWSTAPLFCVFHTKNRRNLFVLSPKEKNYYKWTDFYPGVGGAPLYKLYRCVPPHRVGFLRRFGLKTGINFAHFGLESGMVFEETTECMNVFIVSIPNE